MNNCNATVHNCNRMAQVVVATALMEVNYLCDDVMWQVFLSVQRRIAGDFVGDEGSNARPASPQEVF